ncbi:MAG: hypothetical protein GWN01_00145, partial [Nitrosopumilaceae archaeon]|nr:hypothetical protein [Nitrosopumilaceae archaeon]NIU85759.1 hypothetical protein [Nitrosopumilaceae archaeon]NIV64599.1 hypothetical protein [Nitrosopumilaceae archaeon]NIX60000.1 hypothetical protein [Nitrosopumilaceae archaeon]
VEEILKINGKTVEILDADPNRITIKGNDHGISDWKISEPHWFIFRRPISEHFEDNLFSV